MFKITVVAFNVITGEEEVSSFNRERPICKEKLASHLLSNGFWLNGFSQVEI